MYMMRTAETFGELDTAPRVTQSAYFSSYMKLIPQAPKSNPDMHTRRMLPIFPEHSNFFRSCVTLAIYYD